MGDDAADSSMGRVVLSFMISTTRHSKKTVRHLTYAIITTEEPMQTKRHNVLLFRGSQGSKFNNSKSWVCHVTWSERVPDRSREPMLAQASAPDSE